MLLRLYKEVNAKGDVLQNYSNDSQKYFHLPSLVDNPPDYWPRSCALGHVQLKPVAKIKRQEVVRMYISRGRLSFKRQGWLAGAVGSSRSGCVI